MSKLHKSLPHTFIIFDTEYTSWEGSMEREWSGKNEFKELVQISAIKVKKYNNTIIIKKKLNLYLKPRINPILSQYFMDLTNIQQHVIENEGHRFKDAMKIFYRFCKNREGVKFPIFSYGNDYDVIKENLKLNSINKKSKFHRWGKHFYDIRDIFKNYVDVDKYSSGTLYTAFGIKPKGKMSVHNAMWDSISLFLSLRYIVEGGSNNSNL